MATQKYDTAVGHTLHSCTKEVQAVTYSRPDGSGRNFVFLDTPGFDDNTMSDTEILVAIAEWLTTT
jgi:predicted GTPase